MPGPAKIDAGHARESHVTAARQSHQQTVVHPHRYRYRVRLIGHDRVSAARNHHERNVGGAEELALEERGRPGNRHCCTEPRITDVPVIGGERGRQPAQRQPGRDEPLRIDQLVEPVRLVGVARQQRIDQERDITRLVDHVVDGGAARRAAMTERIVDGHHHVSLGHEKVDQILRFVHRRHEAVAVDDQRERPSILHRGVPDETPERPRRTALEVVIGRRRSRTVDQFDGLTRDAERSRLIERRALLALRRGRTGIEYVHGTERDHEEHAKHDHPQQLHQCLRR